MSEKHVCEVCRRSYFRKNSRGRFCSNKCRQWAFDNRKRVLKRAAGYELTPEQLDDVNAIKVVSPDASQVVLKVCSLAGKDLASEVLDAVWDVMINLGHIPEVRA